MFLRWLLLRIATNLSMDYYPRNFVRIDCTSIDSLSYMEGHRQSIRRFDRILGSKGNHGLNHQNDMMQLLMFRVI